MPVKISEMTPLNDDTYPFIYDANVPIVYGGENYIVKPGVISNQPPVIQTITLDGTGTTTIHPERGRVIAITTAGLGAPENVTIGAVYSYAWRGLDVNVYIKEQADPADIVNIIPASGNLRLFNQSPKTVNYGSVTAAGAVIEYGGDNAILVFGGNQSFQASWALDSQNSHVNNYDTAYNVEPMVIVKIDQTKLPTADPHDAGVLFLTGTALQVSLG